MPKKGEYSTRLDLTNKIFGCLTVLRYSHTKEGVPFWVCLCACGNERIFSKPTLVKGSSKSCGCMRKKREFKGYSGKKIGSLTVSSLSHISKTNTSSSTTVYWNCICRCGSTCKRSSEYLKQTYNPSCGCARKEGDISGEVFGRLTALYRWGKARNSRNILWLFVCDCGKSYITYKSNVTSGYCSSCGCFKKETATETINKVNDSDTNKGPNKYNWKGGTKNFKRLIRDSARYKEWRRSVFTRDRWNCQSCNRKADIVHHIKEFSSILEEYSIKSLEDSYKCSELWDISNGKSLCDECHVLEHKDMPKKFISTKGR